MTIRTRLLLGYCYLVALLVVSAGSAAVGFHGLGREVGRILRENYASVAAAQQMGEALERQDGLVLLGLLAPGDPRTGLETADREFASAFELARKNLTEPGEDELVGRLEAAHAAYQKSRAALLQAIGPEGLAAYRAATQPRLQEVRTLTRSLRILNEQAMRRTDEEMRGRALRASAWLSLLVLLAVVSMAWLARRLQRDFLERLGHLSTFARAIAAGEHRRRVPVGESDELGLVARLLNATLDDRDAVRAELGGQLGLRRELVVGLLGAAGKGAVLLGLDGEFLAGAPPDSAWLAELQAWVRGAGRAVAAAPLVEAPDARAQLLRSADGRPVGWLARAP
jgi:HAMP domain-containing protein